MGRLVQLAPLGWAKGWGVYLKMKKHRLRKEKPLSKTIWLGGGRAGGWQG